MNVSRFRSMLVSAAAMAVLLGFAAPAWAQGAPPCPKPANLPPANSPVLSRCTQLVAHPVNETIVEQATYHYYIKTPQSLPSQQDMWAPYDEEAINADFWRLWRTGFLDNLWIEVIDEPFDNGVAAKHVIFHIEERSRAQGRRLRAGRRHQDGGRQSPRSKTTLRERNIRLNLDSFVDEATIRSVKGVIREVYCGEGLQRRQGRDEAGAAARRAEARPPDVHHQSGPEVQVARSGVRRQHGVQRRARCAAR